jgi:5'-hydroxyaverantin dehydrogenase
MEKQTKKIDFSEKYDTSSLKGKNVLLTGGATGIGHGSAVALAEAGAYVTIADINEKDAQETVTDLTSKGHHAQFIRTDVTSWESLTGAFKAALAFSPDNTIDIVIPAAGVANGGIKSWLEDTPLTEEGDPKIQPMKVKEINLDAVFNTVHMALFYFKNNPGTNISVPKQIIFVASMGGYTSMTGVLDYCTSKWAVRGMFRSLRGAYEILGKDKPKLRCNLIAPTYVKTNMTKNYWAYMEKMGIILAEVSDCTDVVLRMAADETVIGELLPDTSRVSNDTYLQWLLCRTSCHNRCEQAELRPVRRRRRTGCWS